MVRPIREVLDEIYERVESIHKGESVSPAPSELTTWEAELKQYLRDAKKSETTKSAILQLTMVRIWMAQAGLPVDWD